MASVPSPRSNTLLAALPSAEYSRLLPDLEYHEFALGEPLYESGGLLKHVYFPISGIVSLLYVTRTGNSAELALVGNEGMIGVSLFMGGETTPNRAVTQSVSQGYWLASKVVKRHFSEGGPLHLILLKFTQALITQISQTAVCNLHHRVDQRLCRWLLLSMDRLENTKLQMTQELISNMLGVRRQGVTEAAGELERAGLIEYRRGAITMLDRRGLEQRCCECYTVVKNEVQRLLPVPVPVPVPVRVRRR